MPESKTIKPRLGGGLNDYLPAEMLARRPVFEVIQAVFERFGFLPLDTPCIELEEVLTGGDPSFSGNIFRLAGKDVEQPLALRFDLTVPLARVVAAYPNELPKPFKRYQIGQVFRGEKPQAGRYRQFTQFDADIVGSSSVMADAEIVALMFEVMEALGFSRSLTRVNSRKILNGLSAYAGFSDEKTAAVLRAIDKLDRDGWESVSAELAREPDNQYDETALELDEDQITKIKAFLDLRSAGHEEVLDAVEQQVGRFSAIAHDGIEELREMVGYVRVLGVPDERWQIDLSVARGLGYYTGPVFETILLDLPSIGSVFSGGRFDGLVGRFSSGSIPATGASVGVDRLFAAMKELGRIGEQKSVTEVMILRLDANLNKEYASLSQMLRSAGIPTEVYLGSAENIRGQLAYTLKREIPYCIIVGEQEISRNVVQLKDLRFKRQIEVSRPDLVLSLKKLKG